MDVCPHFKWLLLLSKPRRPPLLPTLIPSLSPDQREDGALRQTPIIRPSFTILHLPPRLLLHRCIHFLSGYSCQSLWEPGVERLKTPQSNRLLA